MEDSKEILKEFNDIPLGERIEYIKFIFKVRKELEELEEPTAMEKYIELKSKKYEKERQRKIETMERKMEIMEAELRAYNISKTNYALAISELKRKEETSYNKGKYGENWIKECLKNQFPGVDITDYCRKKGMGDLLMEYRNLSYFIECKNHTRSVQRVDVDRFEQQAKDACEEGEANVAIMASLGSKIDTKKLFDTEILYINNNVLVKIYVSDIFNIPKFLYIGVTMAKLLYNSAIENEDIREKMEIVTRSINRLETVKKNHKALSTNLRALEKLLNENRVNVFDIAADMINLLDKSDKDYKLPSREEVEIKLKELYLSLKGELRLENKVINQKRFDEYIIENLSAEYKCTMDKLNINYKTFLKSYAKQLILK